jgi:hypothetical protein
MDTERNISMIDSTTKILVAIGSVVSAGFGIWHFFVPRVWAWNTYIDARATELILAVNAINIFFSLSLILFGAVNIFLVLGNRSNKYSISIVLGATCVLWFTRVLLQVLYPQGTMNPMLQYSMLSAFVFVFLSYAISLILILRR